MQIQFFGAARTVTGSRHMLTLKNGTKILLDCGLFQGRGKDTDEKNRHLGFDPTEVKYVLLSHAHIDHSGSIPLLVKQGFTGKIYCTPATLDLCKVMLIDSAHIHEYEVERENKQRMKRDQELLKPLYTTLDAKNSLSLFETVTYETECEVEKGVRFHYSDSGHILGSAAINISIDEDGITKRICFTGDIGRYHDRIIKAPAPFPQADYIICESTYGNRLHDNTENAEERLLKIVQETCVKNGGKLIIPAFSLGRTQELVYTLDSMTTKKQLPPIKVFVDSPLSTSATNIMRNHPEAFNEEILTYMKTDPDPFSFKTLQYVQDVNESKMLNELKEPCIIISASGMMEAGRIRHHIKNNIEDSKNTILVVGFCAPGTLGGNLIAGSKSVKLFGEEYQVNAKIEIISSYSAHGDYLEMLKYLECQIPEKVKKLFLVHGEYDVQIEFREKLHRAGFKEIEIPEQESVFEI